LAQGYLVLKKKVLILGSTGMLGHQVVNYFLKVDDYDVIDISFRSKLREKTIISDVKDKTAFEKVVAELNPDFIVNCIGVLIHGSNNVENAIYLNAYLPHQLKIISKNIGAKLIHISTDCVFSGDKGGYIESDAKDGKGVYSQTKKLGEIEDDANLTLRTSIIGPDLKDNGEGLFHWFMNQQGDISGFTKAIWSGVTTIELAKAVKWSIDNSITGLYHVTNNSSISKYELLKLFQKYTKKDVDIKSVDGKIVDKSFIDTRLLMGYEIPSYDQMIFDMVGLISNNRSLYSQYKVGIFDQE
jgi:dTDP-4-dehydrorhamnose reductase